MLCVAMGTKLELVVEQISIGIMAFRFASSGQTPRKMFAKIQNCVTTEL